jgi:hypothetical protein
MMIEADPATMFKSVAAYLSWDHDRLDALLETVRNRVYNSEWATARRDHDEFARGLKRHIRLEEDILFPMLEGVAPKGHTYAMRDEHTRIRGVLGTLTMTSAAATPSGSVAPWPCFSPSCAATTPRRKRSSTLRTRACRRTSAWRCSCA